MIIAIWKKIIRHLRLLEEPTESPYSIRLAVASAVVENTVDFLYYLLSFFTYIYFLAAAYLFFSSHTDFYYVSVRIFRALSEPYLGAVGIYVILKEIRKQRLNIESRHRGELFVYVWLLLLLVAGALVIFSQSYQFDEMMTNIMTISLVLVTIYIGGAIHRP